VIDRDQQPARERGQVVPLLALVVVVAAGAAILLARVGGEVVDRARARNAADAAALAGVTGGRPAAAHVAAANGAVLDRFAGVGDQVEVTVHVGASRATARAAPGGGADTEVAGWRTSTDRRSQVAAAVATRYGP
jgi:hypothetical protein